MRAIAGSTRKAAATWGWWLATAAWMAVIFRMSAMPGTQVPGRFGSLGHFIGYAVLGTLAFMALRGAGSGVGAAALAVLICAAYGVTDEFHQSFVPGRAPDVFDWGVDTLGALCGATMARMMTNRAARRRPR